MILATNRAEDIDHHEVASGGDEAPEAMIQDPRTLMDAAKEMVWVNLPQIAREILTWRQTGLLQGSHLREVANLLQPFCINDALGMAEKLAKDAAFEAIADQN